MAKFLLFQHYEAGAGCAVPIGSWDPADIRAHIDYQQALNADLVADGDRLIAGYRIVDVADERRALAIAARVSAAPGPAGVPVQQPVEVRRIMLAP